jgi:hypothetical protein
VAWAGCKAPVVTSDDHSVLESFFDGDALYIGTAADTPYYVWLMVMFHETAHCRQYQAGEELMSAAYALDPKPWELDADKQSAWLACSLGLDGPALLHDLFIWAYKNYGYDGDSEHGTMAERIHAGDGACTPPAPLEAPVRARAIFLPAL